MAQMEVQDSSRMTEQHKELRIHWLIPISTLASPLSEDRKNIVVGESCVFAHAHSPSRFYLKALDGFDN